MQLDRTHVVIRLRTLSEIGDLALVMIRRYPSSLLIGFAVGAIGWAIANALLLSWIPLHEAELGMEDEEAWAELARYLAWMTVLVILQTPAAGVFTTLYLGQAVFEHRPTWSSVFADGRRQFWRWMWVLGIKRLTIPTMIFLAFRWGYPANPFFDVVVPLCIVVVAAIIRSSRPFMPEILLLEQCPLRSKTESVITMSRRSKSLHTPMASDLGGRFLAVSFVLWILFLSVLYTFVWFRGIATGEWGLTNLFFYLIIYPLSLWVVAGLSVLVRLLNYLDTRIRLEGWEVELAIRAEAMRQFGEDAGLLTSNRPKAPVLTGTRTTSKEQPALTKVEAGQSVEVSS